MRRSIQGLLVLILVLVLSHPAMAQEKGYYRLPAIHGDNVVFTAEGDLWKHNTRTNTTTRLTTHLAEEGAMQSAMRAINALPTISAPGMCLRIIDQPKEFAS